MEYNIIENKDTITVKNIKDFIPKHIFECGQCFRWDKQKDGSYTGVAFNRVINVKKEGDDIIFSNTNKRDFDDIWFNYFDLGRNYREIKQELAKDDILNKAIKHGQGIRILNQDPWEILISFIISANNRIPMIKKSIKILSKRYGEYIEEYKGEKYYSFPLSNVLDDLSIEEITNCGTGFRAKYILNASKIVSSNQIDIYKLKNLSTPDARNQLMLFAGIGPKVSDCIMLFSMNKSDAFPIDIWVKRVMEYFYVDEGTKLMDIQKYAQEKFGNLAGFAQQYLFYYARELGIGRNKKR